MKNLRAKIGAIFRGGSAPRNLLFIHHQPKLPNLGDELCSPKHYFRFSPSRLARTIAVIGGGAYPDFALGAANRIRADHKILWAVGVTLRPDNRDVQFDYQAIVRTFTLCSTRDPEWAIGNIRLVPCVSVFSEICDISPGNKLGIFLNASRTVSGSQIKSQLQRFATAHTDLVVGTNAMRKKEFARLFRGTGRLITNSYHVAYWGLLTGRCVRIVGYSSKFASLLKLFGKDMSGIINFPRGDQAELVSAIHLAIREQEFTRIPDADNFKYRFRNMNEKFAAEAVGTGLFDSISLR